MPWPFEWLSNLDVYLLTRLASRRLIRMFFFEQVVFCSIVCVWVIQKLNSGTREDQLVFTPVDLSTLRSFGVDNIQIMLHPAIHDTGIRCD